MVTLALFLFQKVIQTISRRNSGRELFEALECLENHASNKRSVFLFVCFVFVYLHAGKHTLKISEAKITLKNNDFDFIMLLYFDLLLCYVKLIVEFS